MNYTGEGQLSPDYGLGPVKNRILLHLLGYNNPKNDYNIPIGLTRKGIAKAISANADYVSIPLNELLKEDAIQMGVGHIELGKKKTRYYTLTQKGRLYVKNILEELLNKGIILIESDGSLEEIKFEGIDLQLPIMKRV